MRLFQFQSLPDVQNGYQKRTCRMCVCALVFFVVHHVVLLPVHYIGWNKWAITYVCYLVVSTVRILLPKVLVYWMLLLNTLSMLVSTVMPLRSFCVLGILSLCSAIKGSEVPFVLWVV